MADKFKIPKKPNWEAYPSQFVEGEPRDPVCPYCEQDGQNFCLWHVTPKWVYYCCFSCTNNDGVFRYPRENYKPKGKEQRDK